MAGKDVLAITGDTCIPGVTPSSFPPINRLAILGRNYESVNYPRGPPLADYWPDNLTSEAIPYLPIASRGVGKKLSVSEHLSHLAGNVLQDFYGYSKDSPAVAAIIRAKDENRSVGEEPVEYRHPLDCLSWVGEAQYLSAIETLNGQDPETVGKVLGEMAGRVSQERISREVLSPHLDREYLHFLPLNGK